MTAPWPCSTCGAPGVRNVGTNGHCAWHLKVLFDAFDPMTFIDNGVGLLTGRAVTEFGPLVGDLTCNAPNCGATWVGTPGDPCPWCRTRRACREQALEADARKAVTRDAA